MSAVRMHLATALRRQAALSSAVVRLPGATLALGGRGRVLQQQAVLHPRTVRHLSSNTKPPVPSAKETTPSMLSQAQQAAGDTAASFAKGASESLEWATSSKARESATQAASSIVRSASSAAEYVAKAPATKAATAQTAEAASWFARLVGKAAHQAGTGVVEAANATLWSVLGKAAGFVIVLVMAGGFAYGVGSSLPKALVGSMVWGSRGNEDTQSPGIGQRVGEASSAASGAATAAWTKAKDAWVSSKASASGGAPASNSSPSTASSAESSPGSVKASIQRGWETARSRAKAAIDAVDPRKRSDGS